MAVLGMGIGIVPLGTNEGIRKNGIDVKVQIQVGGERADEVKDLIGKGIRVEMDFGKLLEPREGNGKSSRAEIFVTCPDSNGKT
jgi:hypothetical protein